MKYEVREYAGQWIVLCDGAEVAQFADQDVALTYVADQLREREPAVGSCSLTMRYQARG